MIKHLFVAFLMLLTLGNANAQSGSLPNSQNKTVNSAAVASYSCPMHPEVQSASPGKCPECGMALVLKSAAAYACPMHPHITSMKPGKCSICGMKLQKTQAPVHAKHGCCGK